LKINGRGIFMLLPGCNRWGDEVLNLTILVDNNTLIDSYYLGEPAVSYWIELEGNTYLFDSGYSDVFIKNAEKMGLDLTSLKVVILSHGHDDHTRGLTHIVSYYEHKQKQLPILIAHPDAFLPKCEGKLDIGCPISLPLIKQKFILQTTREPLWLTKNLVFLGEVERVNDYESQKAIGEAESGGKWKLDYVHDDSALVYCGEKGLVIITGCSHSGICNIISYAQKVCKENRIISVIGGFHLLHTEKTQMEKTKMYFARIKAESVYAAHCTDLEAKIELSKVANLKELGVGMRLCYK
jgi:7,8-dihydropterin-6-yl-methyl-4-(beta-D-ribofuranosyl)aminobenzene 5'-phosphate synthase